MYSTSAALASARVQYAVQIDQLGLERSEEALGSHRVVRTYALSS
jgi:hypothetical protein